MKVKIGDFVRLHNKIGQVDDIKVIDLLDSKPMFHLDVDASKGLEYWYRDSDIIGEPSSRITDLIGPGDYVNGWKVHAVNAKNQVLVAYDIKSGKILRTFNEGSIITVVTKEQFESLIYRVPKKINISKVMKAHAAVPAAAPLTQPLVRTSKMIQDEITKSILNKSLEIKVGIDLGSGNSMSSFMNIRH